MLVIYGIGGVPVENFTRDPLIFGCLYQEEGDRRRVWGLDGNFDKGILVLVRGSPRGSYK